MNCDEGHATAMYTTAMPKSAGRWRWVHTAVAILALCVQLDAVDDDRSRIENATSLTLTRLGAWLGGPPRDMTPPSVVTRWLAAPSTMDVEARVAYTIALRYWENADAADRAIAQSLAWYLQSRVVEDLFNINFGAHAYGTASGRYFGGHVPWTFPTLRVTRWRGGLLNAENDTVARGALAFATLERYLGWPALQGALRVLAQDHGGTPLTRNHIGEVIGAAVGQDLSWFFNLAFDANQPIEYALEAMRSDSSDQCGATPCYETHVNVRRLSDASFSGSANDRLGSYESGSAIRLRLTFDDGQTAQWAWDGRDAERTYTVQSPARARTATLDPEGVLLLDRNALDHTVRLQPTTNVPVTKWAARWVLWLQNVLLTYAMLA